MSSGAVLHAIRKSQKFKLAFVIQWTKDHIAFQILSFSFNLECLKRFFLMLDFWFQFSKSIISSINGCKRSKYPSSKPPERSGEIRMPVANVLHLNDWNNSPCYAFFSQQGVESWLGQRKCLILRNQHSAYSLQRQGTSKLMTCKVTSNRNKG